MCLLQATGEETRTIVLNYAVDIWATSIITGLLLAGAHIIPERSFRNYLDGELTFPDGQLAVRGVSEESRGLIREMLQPAPTARISAVAALQHPWLHSLLSESTADDIDRPQSANNQSPATPFGTSSIASARWSRLGDTQPNSYGPVQATSLPSTILPSRPPHIEGFALGNFSFNRSRGLENPFGMTHSGAEPSLDDQYPSLGPRLTSAFREEFHAEYMDGPLGQDHLRHLLRKW